MLVENVIVRIFQLAVASVAAMLAFEMFGSSSHKFWDKVLFHAIAFVLALAVIGLCEFLWRMYRDIVWKKTNHSFRVIADKFGVSENDLTDARREIYSYVAMNERVSTEHILRDVKLPAGFGFDEESAKVIQLIGLYGYGNYAQDPDTGEWCTTKSLRAAKKRNKGFKGKKVEVLR